MPFIRWWAECRRTHRGLLSGAVHRKHGAAVSSAAGGTGPRTPGQCPPSFQAAGLTASCRAPQPQRGSPLASLLEAAHLSPPRATRFPQFFLIYTWPMGMKEQREVLPLALGVVVAGKPSSLFCLSLAGVLASGRRPGGRLAMPSSSWNPCSPEASRCFLLLDAIPQAVRRRGVCVCGTLGKRQHDEVC